MEMAVGAPDGGDQGGAGPREDVTPMDAYLRKLGLYRKLIAKDGSCLFRAVAEQVMGLGVGGGGAGGEGGGGGPQLPWRPASGAARGPAVVTAAHCNAAWDAVLGLEAVNRNLETRGGTGCRPSWRVSWTAREARPPAESAPRRWVAGGLARGCVPVLFRVPLPWVLSAERPPQRTPLLTGGGGAPDSTRRE